MAEKRKQSRSPGIICPLTTDGSFEIVVAFIGLSLGSISLNSVNSLTSKKIRLEYPFSVSNLKSCNPSSAFLSILILTFIISSNCGMSCSLVLKFLAFISIGIFSIIVPVIPVPVTKTPFTSVKFCPPTTTSILLPRSPPLG